MIDLVIDGWDKRPRENWFSVSSASSVVNVRGYWIEAVSAEWMAAAQPLRSKPPAANESKTSDRFAHVIRAARRVTAAAGEQRREHDLVYADQDERDARRRTHAATYLS